MYDKVDIIALKAFLGIVFTHFNPVSGWASSRAGGGKVSEVQSHDVTVISPLTLP